MVLQDLHAKAVAFWKEQIADFNVSRFQEEVSQAFHELNWEHHMEYEADQLYSLDLMLEVSPRPSCWPRHT